MIFDTNVGSTANISAVKESPYEPGLSGALMHVYESQCNWNAIMKSVGISELKYYNETGKDLFVNEAGAFSGFLGKIKAFFNAVKEKIVALFKKFVAFFQSKTMKSKEFAKQYETEARKKAASMASDTSMNLCKGLLNNIPDFSSVFKYNGYNMKSNAALMNDDTKMTSDELDNAKETLRGNCIGGKSMDSDEFREEVVKKFYGDDGKDKEDTDLTSAMVADSITFLKESDKAIKDAEKGQKDSTKAIDDLIKELEKLTNDAAKDKTTSDGRIGNLQDKIELAKVVSDCNTIAYGAYLDALKDKAKQSKAIVLKVLSSKKEESAQYESSTPYDLFSGVKLI